MAPVACNFKLRRNLLMRKENYSDLPTLYHYFVDGSGTARWRREAVTRLNLSDCLDIYTATYNDQ